MFILTIFTRINNFLSFFFYSRNEASLNLSSTAAIFFWKQSLLLYFPVISVKLLWNTVL